MDDLDDLVQYIEGEGGYDLHTTDVGILVVPGWEDFPVRHFRYVKTDPDGTKKVGDAALLDPSPVQLARWVHAAVSTVTGAFDKAKAQALVRHCRNQSGFQFVVRGVHWENMTPVFTAYTFFDGVTVRLAGWDPSWPTTPLDKKDLDFALHAEWNDVTDARLYARIQGTTREEYAANGGLLPTGGKDWLKVVRQCYQEAWGGDANELLTAKARSLF
jgi:endoglucanase